ncbi:hypothetical protein H4582DRAFT_2069571 [Lactarius indigo]|nr:hypothetical protein H4582DRAFT_2069571 [Lactarius indigo]
MNSTPRRPPADLRTPKQPAAYEDEAWNKIRVAQDERTADRFRNARLLQRCLDVWKQGHDWVATTTVQIAHARDTFVLRVAIHKWRAALQHQRERAAHADALAKAHCQKATLVRWHAHLQERQKAAWRADMRTRMQTVRSLRDAALRRDTWAHWRRLYQSRLLQQRVERWRGKLRETEALKGRADEFAAMKEGKVVDRCWDSWRRAAELKSAERVISERVGARIVRESVVYLAAANALERRADKQIARQEGALNVSNMPEYFGKLGRLGRGVYGSQRDLEGRFATKQGAHAFAVQYANAQLQYRVLFNWRVQLRAHVKHFRQAKILEKYFVVRRAWKMWMERAVERGREKRLKEWDKGRAGKFLLRVLKDALNHWTNCIIAVKLRELEVVQRRNKAIVLSAFCKWKKVCIRHVEELGLMESYQDVKREENMRRMFYKWLTAARKVRNRRAILQERESEMQRIQLETVWDKWRGRFQAEKLLPLERTFILQSQHATMYRAFVIWRSRTGSLPAVRFHASCVRAKFWKVWRDAMPHALQAKLARETDKKAVLSRALDKWLQMYRTKVALRAVARARQMRLPTSYKPALTHRSNPMPPRHRNQLPPTPVRPPSPDCMHASCRRRLRRMPTMNARHEQEPERPRSQPHFLPSFPLPPCLYTTAPQRRCTDTVPADLRQPSPTRSAASQPPSTVAATEARASLWAELKGPPEALTHASASSLNLPGLGGGNVG